MLRIIFTRNPIIRDTCVASLSLGRNPTEASADFIVYQKWDWILIFSKEFDIDIVLPTILDNWDPDRIYLPYLGRSVDMVHEIWDVILPNVFFSYSANRWLESWDARFLEIYDEQKDYYVEDYGLSVGGIVVDKTPNDPELNTDLMMTYEADVYIEDSLDAAYTVTSGDLVPALIICGIMEGKASKNDSGTPEQMTIRNMLTTIRLTEDEGGIE